MSFGLESLNGIVRAGDGLAGPHTAAVQFLRFVASAHAMAPAANIAVSELFDIALADMLDTIGSVHLGDADALRPAIDALNSARRSLNEDDKKHHRRMAGELLGAAHSEYEASIAGRAAYRMAYHRKH